MYDRDALLAAVDLRALAEDLLGPGRSNGRSRMWPCPSSQHAQTGRTPPVSIFNSNRGEQRWRCHGCGDGGTAIDLVLACRGGTPRDAMQYLAEGAGHHEQPCEWHPSPRPARVRSLPPAGCRDAAGLDRYVDECAERLWKPEGSAIRSWLTEVRRLPRGVLIANRVGADPGPHAQPRPDGMPRAAGVVLPVMRDGHAVYAQLRIPHPKPDGPRYLNPTSELATNPRVAHVQPLNAQHREVVVTEGVIDALSAAATGHRAVGVLSAAYGDEAVATALAKLPHPLVIAFDADDAGRTAAQRLTALLEARDRPPVVVDLGAGDINDAMRRSDTWNTDFRRVVDDALRSRRDGMSINR